jgi:hypothetical protein
VPVVCINGMHFSMQVRIVTEHTQMNPFVVGELASMNIPGVPSLPGCMTVDMGMCWPGLPRVNTHICSRHTPRVSVPARSGDGLRDRLLGPAGASMCPPLLLAVRHSHKRSIGYMHNKYCVVVRMLAFSSVVRT